MPRTIDLFQDAPKFKLFLMILVYPEVCFQILEFLSLSVQNTLFFYKNRL